MEMKKQVSVGGRYNSTISKMFALEDEMEMKALRESGILESINETLSGAKSGCVTYVGTSGDTEAIERTNKVLKENESTK